MVDDDDCDNGDDGDFFFFLNSGLRSTLVLSIRTLSELPYIIPLIQPAAAPTGVPPQLPQ